VRASSCAFKLFAELSAAEPPYVLTWWTTGFFGCVGVAAVLGVVAGVVELGAGDDGVVAGADDGFAGTCARLGPVIAKATAIAAPPKRCFMLYPSRSHSMHLVSIALPLLNGNFRARHETHAANAYLRPLLPAILLRIMMEAA
jgi:hypothetical protein